MTATATTTAIRHIVTMLDSINLPVWVGVAPDTATYPLILVQVYGDAQDVNGTAGFRALTQVDVQVRAVAEAADLAAVEQPAADIDAALHGTGPAEYTSGTVAACVRISETTMTEVQGGRTWTYLGGRYRLTVA